MSPSWNPAWAPRWVDHPGRETTQVILQRLADDAIQARTGRQLPRLFRRAGLTDLPVTPAMVLAGQQMIRCS